MTWGASTTTATPAAASVPPAFTMKRRRPIIGSDPSPRHEIVVGALGDVVPRTDQRLELRERRLDLAGHRRSLGFLPKNLARQLPEIAQDRSREGQHLDLVLELRPEPVERDRV